LEELTLKKCPHFKPLAKENNTEIAILQGKKIASHANGFMSTKCIV